MLSLRFRTQQTSCLQVQGDAAGDDRRTRRVATISYGPHSGWL